MEARGDLSPGLAPNYSSQKKMFLLMEGPSSPLHVIKTVNRRRLLPDCYLTAALLSRGRYFNLYRHNSGLLNYVCVRTGAFISDNRIVASVCPTLVICKALSCNFYSQYSCFAYS